MIVYIIRLIPFDLSALTSFAFSHQEWSGYPKTCGGDNIPYQVYYLSCNLDHALYGKLNSSDAEKEDDAHKFSKKYNDDIAGFIDFISESGFSKCGDYLESWRFIKESKHSLERYTNLGICIKRAIAGTYLN